MTDAFECDSCGKFFERDPCVKLTLKEPSHFEYETEWTELKTYDLCKNCYEDFQKEFLKGE